MRVVLYISFFLLNLISSFAQGEANSWYFGENAGLDFNSGSPVALTNGQLVTDEGCATISDSSGQLLFYTDGVTVYNKNHQIMVNGTGLMGHASSTQSATIVPKPGSTHLYYIFTTGQESNPNGFRFSIVDMNLDNGNGAVTNDKNNLIFTPTGEHLGITKHANGQDYWIVIHGLHNNSFFAYQLTSLGLESSPVVTNIGAIITGSPIDFFEAGSIKIAPSGSKLAFTSVSDIVQLFDFNNSTGVLTNEITLLTEPGELIGAAFSPDESLLYVSNSHGKIHQFNLNVSDISNSIVTIHQGNIPGQLQVGPDNKIYIAFNNRNYLGVINNPNEIGLDCDFQLNGFFLEGKRSKLGLPSFNQSFFFTPMITLSSNCEGESSTFSFSTNQTVLSASWDFGDGNTSSELQPTHIYTNAGTYNVIVTVVTPLGTGTNSRQITIHQPPVLLSNVVSLKQCDDDNDGFSAFNLAEANELLVSSTLGLSFSYFETFLEAQNNTNQINNYIAYSNQNVSTDQLYVRVENTNSCFTIATLNLIVSTTLIPASFQKTFTVCDDSSSGSDSDGIATFNFSSVISEIQSLFPAGQLLDISFYQNISDALAEQNSISNTSNFINTNSPTTQNIYVRVDSQLDNECLGLGHHITLNVEAVPILQPLIYTECDDNNDGIFGFNTTTLESSLLTDLSNVIFSYRDENNAPLPSPLPNPFFTHSQTVKVRATNTTTNSCYYESTISFVVDDLPEINTIPIAYTTLCDDEVNPMEQDGLVAFDTLTFQNTLLGNQTGMIVNYFDQTGNPLPSPLPNPFVSGTQNILVEVINPNNSNCKATAVIPLMVNQVPVLELEGEALICSDDPSFTEILTAGLMDENLISNYTYQWYKDGQLIENATDYSLNVNSEGSYYVTVTNSSECVRTRTFTVTASNKANIEEIEIMDMSDNNSITILVSGFGDYVFSLDNTLFQSSNTFESLEAGIYTVFVKDLNGCGTITKEINILGVPKFFTPNGDGYNDVWNIKGANNQQNSATLISIFDRYGSLLKQISPLGLGWDGTSNGLPMPSSDYWYSIKLQDGRIIKGHFSLKR